MTTDAAVASVVENAIVHHHPGILEAIELSGAPAAARDGFDPGFALPPLEDAIADFYAASDASVAELGSHRGRRLSLLNLMHNPRTRTTKTFASLLIVARAIRYVRETGRRVMIVTPTSANKGTALMDAVLRALDRELVGPDRLRIAVIVPRESMGKLWSSALTEDPLLRDRNPVLVHDGPDPEAVKALARGAVNRCGPELSAEGTDLWHTMQLDNYRVADAVRAFLEADLLPPDPGRPRVHAHAVSSGFGLLGYDLGRAVLARRRGSAGRRPIFFLVQHLRTPDMVLALRFGSFSRDLLPAYRWDGSRQLFVQAEDPCFPFVTDDPEEGIDPTFYTRRPATMAAVREMVEEGGGGGIVVSHHDCLARYDEVGSLLAGAGVALPPDPADLREWALVMALTGVLNAVDRDLLPDPADIVVHGSGSYGTADYRPVDPSHARPVAGEDDVSEAILSAARTA